MSLDSIQLLDWRAAWRILFQFLLVRLTDDPNISSSPLQDSNKLRRIPKRISVAGQRPARPRQRAAESWAICADSASAQDLRRWLKRSHQAAQRRWTLWNTSSKKSHREDSWHGMSRCFANSASVNWKSESLGILKYERNPNVLIQAFQSWRCKKCFQFAVDHVRLMCDYWPLSLVLPWAHKCNIFNHLDVSTKSTWWLDVSAASPRLDGFLSGIDGLTATWHWLSNNARSVDATAFIGQRRQRETGFNASCLRLCSYHMLGHLT